MPKSYSFLELSLINRFDNENSLLTKNTPNKKFVIPKYQNSFCAIFGNFIFVLYVMKICLKPGKYQKSYCFVKLNVNKWNGKVYFSLSKYIRVTQNLSYQNSFCDYPTLLLNRTLITKGHRE